MVILKLIARYSLLMQNWHSA